MNMSKTLSIALLFLTSQPSFAKTEDIQVLLGAKDKKDFSIDQTAHFSVKVKSANDQILIQGKAPKGSEYKFKYNTVTVLVSVVGKPGTKDETIIGSIRTKAISAISKSDSATVELSHWIPSPLQQPIAVRLSNPEYDFYCLMDKEAKKTGIPNSVDLSSKCPLAPLYDTHSIQLSVDFKTDGKPFNHKP